MRLSGNRERIPLLIAACFALLLVGGVGIEPTVRGQLCPSILIETSNEKYDLLRELATEYSTSHRRAPICNDPLVTVQRKPSGEAEALLEHGWNSNEPRPDVWAPAATTWLDLLRASRPDLVSDDLPPSIARSPLVVAMPMPIAQALGWPAVQPTWTSLLQLARDPGAYQRLERANVGPFRLGKTDPNASTSGLHSLLAEYYAAAGKSANLSVGDIDRSENRRFVSEVEASVAHYADTVDTCMQNLTDANLHGRPLSYVSAVAAEEQEVFAYNTGKYNDGVPPVTKLAALYPSDGTLVADHPFAVMNWATTGQRTVAGEFLKWLLMDDQQSRLLDAGFRNDRGDAGTLLAATPGILSAQPKVFERVQPQVVKEAIGSWRTLRKRARVLVLLGLTRPYDRHRVMDALTPFADGDSVAVWSVTPGARDGYSALLGMSPIEAGGMEQVRRAVEAEPIISGRAPLHPAILAAYQYMSTGLDPTRVNAVVVISGAGDNGAPPDDLTLLNSIQPNLVHVYTVALGNDASLESLLKKVSRASGGVYEQSSSTAIQRALADF